MKALADNAFNAVVLWTLFIVVIAVGAVDIVLMTRFPEKQSISNSLLQMGINYPIIPLLFGILLGHIFWPQHH